MIISTVRNRAYEWLIIGLALALVASWVAIALYAAGSSIKLAQAQSALSKAEAKHLAYVADSERQRANDEAEARRREAELRAAADAERERYAKELSGLADRHARAVAGLRDRPSARSTSGQVATASAPAAGCTGAGLSRPDAEVALWFAARAAQHASERDLCYSQYGKAEALISPKTDPKHGNTSATQ